uniref:C2H2-type domain-containing protein n=1 Tax=Plectus sambesii TaxID=2011161 RepID=A0A914W0W7_9BILA
MNEVVCSMCALSMARSDLEGHICSEHLDYYPYGCGFCGHWLATEDLAHFHAQKRQHLPMKIKENPNMHKERRLREILQQSLLASGQSGMQSPQLSVWQRNESSPSSTMNPDSGIDSILASDVSSRSPNATPLSQSSTKDAALDSDALPMSRLEADTRNKRSHNFEQQTLSQSFLGSNSKKSRIDSSATDDPAPIPIGDHPNEVHCRLCQMWLRGLNKLEHVKNHIKCRPRAACMYCQFKGATQNSVRVHITWKHAGRSTKVGFGVKDLSDIGSSEEEMIEMCFGSAPMTNTMEELMTITGCKARTAKAQPMPRTTIGSTKSMGGSVYARSTESGVSALIRQDPLPSVGVERSNATADVQKRVSTSASGRQYK